MPWQQVLMDGRSTLRFAAVCYSPDAQPFSTPEKRPLSGQSSTSSRKTETVAYAQHTLDVSVFGRQIGQLRDIGRGFLFDPGQVLITTQHVRYLFAQQNRADSLPERLAMVGMVDVKSKSC